MKFEDIPQLTQSGSYEITQPWKSVENTLRGWQEEYGLELDPDFQRAHVWTEDKQIAYVEYVLRGGKASRVIYFNCFNWSRISNVRGMVLVDGKQRLEAVRRFLSGETPAFGAKIHEYEGKLHTIHHAFLFNVNDLPTRADVLQFYLDINSGGVVHTIEEIEKVKRLLEAEALQQRAEARKGVEA